MVVEWKSDYNLPRKNTGSFSVVVNNTSVHPDTSYKRFDRFNGLARVTAVLWPIYFVVMFMSTTSSPDGAAYISVTTEAVSYSVLGLFTIVYFGWVVIQSEVSVLHSVLYSQNIFCRMHCTGIC